MRVLRVLIRSGGRIGHLEAHLQIGEPRTRDGLLERAGLTGWETTYPIGLEEFLQLQRFIPSDHPGLAAIWSLLTFI